MAGHTILVIEDNSIHREELAWILQSQRFRIITATDGGEALNTLAVGPVPDLILLDMLIPSGSCDGWWFLQQRQRHPTLASVPVLIMTSLSVASDEWAVSLGAAGLVRKPFETDALLEQIRRCLDKASQVG